LLSYNRNPFVIKLLSDNFTQFNSNGYNNPGIAQREVDNIMVDFDGSNPELLLIINKVNMKNFIGNTQTLYFPKNIGINPKGYEIIRKLDNNKILYMCDYDKSVNEKLLFYMNYHLYDIIKDKYINMLPSCYYYIIKYKSDLVKYNMIKCLIAFNNSEWIHLLNIDMPEWLEIINEFEGLLPYALCKNANKHILKILINKHYNRLDWSALSENPNAIELLEKNLLKIDWIKLSLNPMAGKLLEDYEDFLF
jgi:hypothetical protein